MIERARGILPGAGKFHRLLSTPLCRVNRHAAEVRRCIRWLTFEIRERKKTTNASAQGALVVLGCERDAVAPESAVAEMVLLDGEIDRSKTSRERWDAALTQSAMNSASLADATEQQERMLRALVAVQNQAATLGVDTEEVLALLKRSQDAWWAHFQAELAFRWPSDVLGGSITPMCVATDVAIMYRIRAEVLEELLHGEEGNVCNAQWGYKREHSVE